ncbi:MAG TPA: class I SAM-dependent methyltransferase [Spirochaetia bacterium]|nr:class I SAM-dependent methyltransferase [Spirochaetia bacterium]
MGINYWDTAYESGHVPWDPGPYDGHVPRLVRDLSIEPCRVVDIGCGAGGTLIWLAEAGFDCTGIEIAPAAVRLAKETAKKRGVACTWLLHRFPNAVNERALEPRSFDLAIDRGVFHLHTSRAEQDDFVAGVAQALRGDGLWYSLLASSKRGSAYGGPPRWSEREIRRAVEPAFEILRIEDSVFTPGEEGSMAAWVCVMRKRAAGRQPAH